MSVQPSLTQVLGAPVSSDRISIIPIVKEIPLATESVTTSFRNVRAKAENQHLSFLLEIATPEDPIKTQYSIIGVDPYSSLRTGPSESRSGDPLTHLQSIISSFDVPEEFRIAEPSILNGGAFGYISYDCVRYYEYKVAAYPQPDNLNLPESLFMFCGSFICFDHVKRTIKIVALCLLDADGAKREANYAAATSRIAELESALADHSNPSYLPPKLSSPAEKRATTVPGAGEAGYKSMVRKLKERIVDGDIIQCVPSHRVTRDASQFHALEIYETLRQLNPSRYMFYVECETFYIVGSSPELLVKVHNGLVETHPIAGTRPRGKTTEEDLALEKDLLADEKERAEHIMLVDLGRNDVNRVAKPETTKVNSLMHIERYSHVMHIVSRVTGQLRPGCSAFDAFRSIFPAGTLTGAPKVKAMELIAQLEAERRNIYGGSVGFFSFDGNIDTSIAIRTMVIKDDLAYLQAGGGIVFDSTEEAEYQETVNKMAATARAVDTCKKSAVLEASSPAKRFSSTSSFNKPLEAAYATALSSQGVSGSSKSVVSAGVRLAIPEKPSGNITLMIDNFDSFTWNIYQYLCQLSDDPVVVLRNDASLAECIALNPKRVVISPGPGWPHEAGVSNDAIKHFLGKVPLLGVCLGHECLVELYGGKIIHCGEIMHGKTSKMYHDGKGVFQNVADGFEAIRYHSLAADPQVQMPDFEITCKTSNGIIQGIRHKKYKVEGVQFHPESIKTEHGLQMIKNFLSWEGSEW